MTDTPIKPLPVDGCETMADFARRLGVARSTVTRAAQAGRLSMAPDGRVRVADSLLRWHATRGGRDDMAQIHAQARGAAIPHPMPYPSAENGSTARFQAPPGLLHQPATGATDEDDSPGRMAHQMAREAWRNAALRLEMDLASGARVSRAAAVAEALALGGMLRGAVERLIDQTAPRLAAAAASPADQRRLLLAQLHQVRRQIRRELPQAMRRLRPSRAAGSAA